ncbi:MAG TPA: LLM class flavin-dependent oxidoreductase [Trebonia sp.]|nr:LLM class flavin-dependent oxidoreductase [Trebonia sp.]
MAKQLADLDSRSGGRVSVGVGVGGEFRQEFEAVGVPVSERGARTDEALQILRKLWRGGPVSHEGKFLADGWLPYLISPGAYQRSTQTIRDEARAQGRDLDGIEWMMYLYCSVRRDGDRARQDVAGFLGGAYGDKPGAMLDRIAPAGTPEQVAERLQEYVDAGVRYFIISPASRAGTLEIVTLAAEEVLPRLSIPSAAGRAA